MDRGEVEDCWECVAICEGGGGCGRVHGKIISEGRIVFDGEVIVGEGLSSREGGIDGGVFVV